jgi:hypothetical protein
MGSFATEAIQQTRPGMSGYDPKAEVKIRILESAATAFAVAGVAWRKFLTAALNHTLYRHSAKRACGGS